MRFDRESSSQRHVLGKEMEEKVAQYVPYSAAGLQRPAPRNQSGQSGEHIVKNHGTMHVLKLQHDTYIEPLLIWFRMSGMEGNIARR